MIFEVLNVKNYIPKANVKKVQDINFQELYNQGKRVVLSDLDNTLISYAYSEPNETMISFVNELKEIGFTVIIISNSPSSRVLPFLESLNVNGVALARKPLKKYMIKGIKDVPYRKEEMVFLGDQFMTDVLVGNRLGIDTYLVDAIERKSEKWYTRINRRLERIVLRKIKRKYSKEYKEVLYKVGEKYGL